MGSTFARRSVFGAPAVGRRVRDHHRTAAARPYGRVYDAAMATGAAPKPELHLMPGRLAFDPEVLVAMFVKLIGRAATEQEIAEVREIFEQRHSAGVDEAAIEALARKADRQTLEVRQSRADLSMR